MIAALLLSLALGYLLGSIPFGLLVARATGGPDPRAIGSGRLGGTDGGTIYLTTADRWGNMVSLVHSVFSVYGSRATVGPYGFVLHNRGSAFSNRSDSAT